jgi:peptidoglycan DL-endopeptidase CwlO
MRRWWPALALYALLVCPLGGGLLIGTTQLVAASAQCGPAGIARQVSGVDLDAEQLANAAVIVEVTRTRALPARAAVIAVATALQESSLRNLDHGDTAGPDSRGLFQQRIRFYGADVATEPARATGAFLDRLIVVPGWDAIPLTVAAATVQRPRADLVGEYARWESTATELVGQMWSDPSDGADPATAAASSTFACGQGGDGVFGDGVPALPAGYQLPTAGQGALAVRTALAQLGKPYVWGGVGPRGFDCSGLTMTSWAAAGVAIPRTAAAQSAGGVPVAGLGALQPGDLLFIAGTHGSASSPGHVGMYIGTVDGVPYLVQAPRTGLTVEVDRVSRWDGLIVGIRRPVVPKETNGVR